MRIAHLVNHCRLGHGNAHMAVDLACVQASKGDRVFFLSEGGDFEALLGRSGVQHVTLPQNTRNPALLITSAAKLARLGLREKLDIVHAHMMSGAVLGFLATRLTATPLVATVHNSFDRHSVLMRVADLVIAVSAAEKRYLISRGFRERRVAEVLNGPLESPRLAGPLGEAVLPRPSITTVCGLHRRKGVGDLIAGFEKVAPRHPDAHLNIVGNGPDRAALEIQAERSGYGSRIRFHGQLANPQTLLRATDIFVLASHHDPFPLVNMEARLAGCAMIGTAVGGIPEALEHGRAGVLIPPGDPDSIAGALDRLLGNSNELERFKAAARSGLDKFSTSRMYADYERAYQAVVADRHDPVSRLAFS
jgi:glycosyltransferase involved in cell wall biosynthesis